MTVAKRGRAIVLGGGGVTGIAWEVRVLAGLRSAGVDLNADAVFGTSAGSFVGVAFGEREPRQDVCGPTGSGP